MTSVRMKKVNVCDFCKKKFHPLDSRPEQQYCSFDCYKESRWTTKTCKNCEVRFRTYTKGYKHKDFCCWQCRKEGYRGWTIGLTKETSEKIRKSSEKISKTRKKMFKEGILTISQKSIDTIRKQGFAMRGKKKSPKSIEKLKKTIAKKIESGTYIPPMHKPGARENLSKTRTGIKFTDKHKEAISLSKKKDYTAGKMSSCIGAKGKENHAYIHGNAYEPYTTDFNEKFKRAVRRRDNQICLLCGIHREKLKRALHIHHINYDKKLTIPENCISLCASCHGKTHSNRKHWQTFFQSLLSDKYGYEYNEGQVVLNLAKNQ